MYAKINSMKKEYLECGRVVAAHGVRGILKVESWCDSPKVLAGQKRVFVADSFGKYNEIKVASASVSGNLVLLGLESVTSREAAFAMKNTVLYLKREDIPVAPGQMLLQDMIGLDVIDADTGRVYGKIKDITDAPRSKIYTVETQGGEVLFPAVGEFVKEIDENRGVLVRPIPGFFDEE